MNQHDQYMRDFMSVFETLEYWAPNSEADTTKAYRLLSTNPESILEIGCGKGNSTIVLAKLSSAKILATDNAQSALDKLDHKIEQNDLRDRIFTKCISMTELAFGKKRFDLVWAEASAYVMGIESALKKWKALLSADGTLVFSDLVWLTDNPSQEAIDHWKNDYPDIQTVDTRQAQIEKAGYQLQQTFTVSEHAWKCYYEPLEQRLKEVAPKMRGSQAVVDIKNEIDLYKSRLGEFGYQFFIAKTR